MTPPLSVQAAERGLSILYDFGEQGGPYQLGSLVTSRRRLHDTPELVSAYVAGFVEACQARRSIGRLVVLGAFSLAVAPLLPSGDGVRVRDRLTDDDGGVETRRSLRVLWEPYRGAGTLFREDVVGIAVVASGVAVMLSHLRASFLPLYCEGLGWSASLIGVVPSVAALAGIASRALHPLIDRRIPMWLYLAGCLVLGSLGITVSVATSSLAVVVGAMAVSGFMLGASNPITLTLLARNITAERRGLGVGLRLTMNRFGTTAGPMLCGALASLGGVRLTMAAMTLAGATYGVAASRPFKDETALDRYSTSCIRPVWMESRTPRARCPGVTRSSRPTSASTTTTHASRTRSGSSTPATR